MNYSKYVMTSFIIATGGVFSLLYVAEDSDEKSNDYTTNNNNFLNILNVQGSDIQPLKQNKVEKSSDDVDVPMDLESGTEREFGAKEDDVDVPMDLESGTEREFGGK
jgi:hypothetical protein